MSDYAGFAVLAFMAISAIGVGVGYALARRYPPDPKDASQAVKIVSLGVVVCMAVPALLGLSALGIGAIVLVREWMAYSFR